MNEKYYFPFGEELKKVVQKDQRSKKAFVLGVYASAIHAKWIDKEGKQKVAALAVASEPEIFWRGENANEIIEEIKIPEELGKLIPPSIKGLNGPSGRALDELYLQPLGLDRKDVWLCDLLPESRVNDGQRKAINRCYTADLVKKYNLPEATVPDFNKDEFDSEIRRDEILKELEESKAKTLILLGDLPIQKFLKYYVPKFDKLSQFGTDKDTYGIEHHLQINGKEYRVIPLCHPRQANKLGSSNQKWYELHNHWRSNMSIQFKVNLQR